MAPTRVDGTDGEGQRVAHVRVIARAEVGRRSVERTAIRGIASAAGISTGTLCRITGRNTIR